MAAKTIKPKQSKFAEADFKKNVFLKEWKISMFLGGKYLGKSKVFEKI